jgi:predicted O-methyltransferase YrrM
MIKQYIQNKIYALFSRILDQDSKNIKRERSRIALKETIDYIDAHMSSLMSVESKYKVHEVACSKIMQDGVILEFGVYKGDTINFLASINPDREVIGFDSFEGLPEDWREGFGKGTFKMDQLPRVRNNVTLIKGWFDETLPEFIKNNSQKISYLHIDCDLYSSTKSVFSLLAKYIQPGTVIVFDEYFNYPGWKEGEYKAFQEFVAEYTIKYDYITYNALDEQVALIIRGIDNV